MTIYNDKAPIREIFYSYQGEGLYIGLPQIFVRFDRCNLRCIYCDTLYNKNSSVKRKSKKNSKFLSKEEVFQEIIDVQKKNNKPYARSVSFTGGEPLLFPEFLIGLSKMILKSGFNTYLETNGTLPNELILVKEYMDVIAMDIKLPSSCGKSFWFEHKRFLDLAKDKDIFVKVVITAKTQDKEIEDAVRLVKSISKDIPFVFQPVSPNQKCRGAKPYKLYEWMRFAKDNLNKVYILPQMQNFWKVH